MFRLYDWRCLACMMPRPHVIEFATGTKPPQKEKFKCLRCKKETTHDRMLPLVGFYYGERTDNPIIAGGKFDTTGHAALPALPVIPDDIHRDSVGDFFTTKEYKNAKRERLEAQKINKAKRKRYELIKKGANINMRRDKLLGDPKFT